MLDKRIRDFEMRIAEEEKHAGEAGSRDKALAHQQAAMIYQSELALIRRRRAAAKSEMLASIA